MNKKIYVGKHKSTKHPCENGYYGSGKLITAAIKKYGIENFTKEVLHYCSSLNEMSAKEAEIVTEEFVKRKDTYNMHKGGAGGWDHYNGSSQHRQNSSKGGRKSSSRENNPFRDPEFQKKYSHTRSPEHMKLMNERAKAPEVIAKRKETLKLRGHAQGHKNSQFGTKIYIDKNHIGDLPPTSILNKQRYKPGAQPENWIPILVWRDNQKNKNSNAYGKHWYNDGQKNYYLYPNDTKIIELQLEKRRLKIKNCCGFNK